MAKSAQEKAVKKQIKEAKKQADDTARRERAKSIIDGQPIRNGMRSMDGNAEQLLNTSAGFELTKNFLRLAGAHNFLAKMQKRFKPN